MSKINLHKISQKPPRIFNEYFVAWFGLKIPNCYRVHKLRLQKEGVGSKHFRLFVKHYKVKNVNGGG